MDFTGFDVSKRISINYWHHPMGNYGTAVDQTSDAFVSDQWSGLSVEHAPGKLCNMQRRDAGN